MEVVSDGQVLFTPITQSPALMFKCSCGEFPTKQVCWILFCGVHRFAVLAMGFEWLRESHVSMTL